MKTGATDSVPCVQRQPAAVVEATPPGAGNEAGELARSPRMTAQRQQLDAAFGPSLDDRASNRTGMPDSLKAGIESLSGVDLSDVQVHTNSDKPAQLNALAYAQGNDIHLAPGQERHLPHEAWHVVQQRQGRVRPTTQLAGVGVNDDAALEAEADEMGHRAAQTVQAFRGPSHMVLANRDFPRDAIQRVLIQGYQNADVPPTLDTANIPQAVSIIRTLAVAEDETAIVYIFNGLDGHVMLNVGVTANDTKLLDWLRPIGVAAKQVMDIKAEIGASMPAKLRLQVAEVAKRIALVSGSLAASGALLSMDTLVSWLSTPPQTNVIFGSLSMVSSTGNYSVHTPGLSMQVHMVDPETNRSLEGTIDIPDRQSHILGGGSETNITQNPFPVPQDTQNFHTFALVATNLAGLTAIASGAVWWLAKPSQSTVDQIAKLSADLRRAWKKIVLLTQAPPL